jgi:hypothetical protein
MKFFDGNCSIREMEDRLRILRKLRAGLSGERLHDSSDVSVLDQHGRPNGNDPHAQSHTVRDAVRSDSDPVPATAPWASSPLSVH